MTGHFKGIHFFLMFLSGILLTGCEGFKTVQLYNQTGHPITIQTKVLKPDKGATPSNEAISYQVPADSSIAISRTFDHFFLLFIPGIREPDLTIQYLKIMTPEDTIVASSPSEILLLTKKDPTRFRKKTDRTCCASDGTNEIGIVVRH